MFLTVIVYKLNTVPDFYFVYFPYRICSDDDCQMNWAHIKSNNQSNVSLTSYCKNLHLFILFCIDNLTECWKN